MGSATSLLREFERYYKTPLNTSVVDCLLESLLAFDELDRWTETTSAIHELGCTLAKKRVKPITLKTNTSRSYQFPGNFYHIKKWADRVYRQAPHCLIFLHNPLHRVYEPTLEARPDEFVICLDLSEHLDFLEAQIEKLGPVTLYVKPNTLLQITTNPTILARVNALNLNCITNSDWEPIYKTGLKHRVVDQMIDWYSGLNFYTCDAGEKHVLPLFHLAGSQSQNLLNTEEWCPKTIDDEFVPVGPTVCSCGKKRLSFKYTSHKINNPAFRTGFVKDLRSQYVNLQIHAGDVNEVFYVVNGEFLDENLLIQHFGPCQFRKDQFFTVGNKYYNFWKSERAIPEVYTSAEKINSLKKLKI